jgi:SAM-dependent methyltransferase
VRPRVDPRAALGFAGSARSYERGRPGYPADAIAGLIEQLGIGRESVVVDLAAGTGKLTRLLSPYAGAVIAVEPVGEMRRELAAQVPDVTILDGIAEAIPLENESVDAVFVGEAFHWFRTADASFEIARVLKRGGGLALLWNVPTWTEEDTPWLSAFRETLDEHKRAAGAYPAGHGEWKGPLTESGLFEELQRAEAVHVQRLTIDDFVAQVASWSWIAGLPDAARARVLSDVRALLEGRHEIAVPYRTEIYWTRLI